MIAGYIGTAITVILTSLATLINLYGYKKLPIMEGIVILLYVAVFIAMVSFAISHRVCLLT